MGAAAIPYLMAASVAVQVYSTVETKKAANEEAQAAARDEELSSNEREIANKKRLLASIAQQNVTGAAGGIQSYTGSSGNIINTDIKEHRKVR